MPAPVPVTKRRAHIVGAALCGLALCYQTAAPVLADPADVSVTGGRLAVGEAPEVAGFVEVSIGGSVQTVTTELGGFTVIDARGTGAGWSLSVSASPLAQWDGSQREYVAAGAVLPPGSLVVPALSVYARGTSSRSPRTSASAQAIDLGPVKLAAAALGSGMGVYRFAPSGPLILNVPAGARAVVYRSEITVSVASGP